MYRAELVQTVPRRKKMEKETPYAIIATTRNGIGIIPYDSSAAAAPRAKMTVQRSDAAKPPLVSPPKGNIFRIMQQADYHIQQYILLNFLKNLLKIFTNLPLCVLSLHRLRLENRSAAEATRTRIAIQVKYGTNDQKHRGCLADAEEQPHQQTVGHDDLRLVPQSSGIEQVEHRLGKRSRKSGLFLFFQTIRSRAQAPLTINPGSQGSRGFRIAAERAPSLRRNIFRLRLGGRKPPFAASRIGQRPCLEFAHRHAVHQADRPLDPHAVRTAARTLRGLLHARTSRSETQQSEQRGYDSGIHILSSIGHVSCRIHRQIYA